MSIKLPIVEVKVSHKPIDEVIAEVNNGNYLSKPSVAPWAKKVSFDNYEDLVRFAKFLFDHQDQ